MRTEGLDGYEGCGGDSRSTPGARMRYRIRVLAHTFVRETAFLINLLSAALPGLLNQYGQGHKKWNFHPRSGE